MAVNDELGLPRVELAASGGAQMMRRCIQFIGQDNLYFYGVAQPAIVGGAASPDNFFAPGETSHLRCARRALIANHHLLLGNKKASSSGCGEAAFG